MSNKRKLEEEMAQAMKKRRYTACKSSSDADRLQRERARAAALATPFGVNSGASSSSYSHQLPNSTIPIGFYRKAARQPNRPPPSSHPDPDAIPSSTTSTPPLDMSCYDFNITLSGASEDEGMNEDDNNVIVIDSDDQSRPNLNRAPVLEEENALNSSIYFNREFEGLLPNYYLNREAESVSPPNIGMESVPAPPSMADNLNIQSERVQSSIIEIESDSSSSSTTSSSSSDTTTSEDSAVEESG